MLESSILAKTKRSARMRTRAKWKVSQATALGAGMCSTHANCVNNEPSECRDNEKLCFEMAARREIDREDAHESYFKEGNYDLGTNGKS